MGLYMRRRALWRELRRRYEEQGEKFVAAAMGHSLETHLAAYSRWIGDDEVDAAVERASQRMEQDLRAG